MSTTVFRGRGRSGRPLALVRLAVLAVVAAAPGQAALAAPDDLYPAAYRGTVGDLGEPAAIAFTPEGRLLVAERSTGRVRIVDPAGGAVELEFGAFRRPTGVAVRPDGIVAVADAADAAVRLHRPDGSQFLVIAGGRFVDPAGVAFAGDVLWVADPGAEGVHRIDLADPEAARRFIGGWGTDPGRFSRPLDVAADEDGFVYVVDADNDRIQKLDPEGRFVAAWGESGPFEGLLDEPSSVEVVLGRVVVTDRRNHRVKIYDREGDLLRTWGRHALRPREGEGALHYPDAFAADPARGVAAVAEGFEDRVQFLDLADGPSAEPPYRALPAQVHFGPWISIAPPLMVLTEPEAHRVHLFDLTREIPIVIGDFGERGRGPGLLLRTTGAALDLDGRRVELLDLAKRRVQRFGVTWEPDQPRGFVPGRFRFSEAWEMGRLGAARPDRSSADAGILPSTLRIGRDGTRWTVDGRGAQVLAFDADWTLLRASMPGLERPTDLALVEADDGKTAAILVVDADRRAIVIGDGGEDDPGRPFERPGGGFVEPYGIAVHGDLVFVGDRGAHRIDRFRLVRDAEGLALEFLGSFGSKGIDHGELWKPAGLAVDDRDRLFVVDFGNHRAKIFSLEGEWLATFGTGRAVTPRNLNQRGARPRRGDG